MSKQENERVTPMEATVDYRERQRELAMHYITLHEVVIANRKQGIIAPKEYSMRFSLECTNYTRRLDRHNFGNIKYKPTNEYSYVHEWQFVPYDNAESKYLTRLAKHLASYRERNIRVGSDFLAWMQNEIKLYVNDWNEAGHTTGWKGDLI